MSDASAVIERIYREHVADFGGVGAHLWGTQLRAGGGFFLLLLGAQARSFSK
jgi:hypothetical protein